MTLNHVRKGQGGYNVLKYRTYSSHMNLSLCHLPFFLLFQCFLSFTFNRKQFNTLPFLKWQNCGSKAAKVPGERADHSLPPQDAKKQLLTSSMGGEESDSGQIPSCTRAAPGVHERPGVQANRASKQGAGQQLVRQLARRLAQGGQAGRAQFPFCQPG